MSSVTVGVNDVAYSMGLVQELLPTGFHGSWTDTCMPAQAGETLPYENDIRVSL